MIKDHRMSDIEALAVLEQQQSEGVERSHFESKYLQLIWIPFYITLSFWKLTRSEPKLVWLQTLRKFFISIKITVILMGLHLFFFSFFHPYFLSLILSIFHILDLSCWFLLFFYLYFLLFFPFILIFFLSFPSLLFPSFLFSLLSVV